MPGKEFAPRRESQPDNPYVRAARFVADADALATYTQAQELIFSSDADLSAYRIRYVNVPYVVVLGQTPAADLGQQVDTLLGDANGRGEPANLPQDIIKTLSQRRNQARRLGPWVEGHYRPGIQG
jgi:hypothetical protein